MLFEPMTLGGHVAKNRVWLAPMTNLQSHEDGSLSDDELRWLTSRAEGGFGVIESCAAHVTADGKSWAGQLGIDSDAMRAGWQRIADAAHAHGALVIAQLFHGGARALPSVGPVSAVASADVRAATPDELRRIVDAFGAAAERAAAAGLDGVELHAAHGYLLCQFLQPTNVRQDGWGGDRAGRARLVRDVLRAVRERTPRGFAVGVRVSPEAWGVTRQGPPPLDLDDSLELARVLVEDGIDFLHVSLWDAAQNSVKRPDAHPLALYRSIVPPTTPLITAGNIWTRADAEAARGRGAGAVALGRAAIVNPRWPLDARGPHFVPRRPPATKRELQHWGLSPKFIAYMERWPHFVQE